MSNALRVVPSEVRERVVSGNALLVCAYGSDEKFHANHLEGAISLSQFNSRLPDLEKDTELIFYCA
jgi:hypothetical protein